MNIQLSRSQLFLLMFVMQTGFVYTSFQNLIIEHSNRDATIQFIAVAIVCLLQLLLFERTYKYFVLNKLTKAIYLLYWFSYLIVFTVYITYVLTTWVFINTPNSVLIAIFLAICFYASVSRPETAVNLGVVLLPLLFIFVFIMLRAIPNLHPTNLLPLLHERKDGWMLGFVYSTYAFGGAEMYLILRKYLIKSQRMTYKVLSFYFLFLTCFYLFSIILTLTYFSLDEILLIPEPVFYILHSLEVEFVQRLDLIFVFIWLSWSLIAIVNYVLVIRLVYFEKKRKAPVLQQLIFFIMIGTAASILTRFSILDFFKHYVVYANIVFSFLLPVIIIVINKFRRRTISESTTSS